MNAREYFKLVEKNENLQAELISKLSDRFSLIMRCSFLESELIAMDYANTYCYDAKICASHDFCDANMLMLEAMNDLLASKMVTPADEPLDALSNDNEAHEVFTEIWNNAWAISKGLGFSKLWSIKTMVPADNFKLLAQSISKAPKSGRIDPAAYPTGNVDHDLSHIADMLTKDPLKAHEVVAVIRAADEDYDDVSEKLIEAFPDQQTMRPLC